CGGEGPGSGRGRRLDLRRTKDKAHGPTRPGILQRSRTSHSREVRRALRRGYVPPSISSRTSPKEQHGFLLDDALLPWHLGVAVVGLELVLDASCGLKCTVGK